MGANTNDLAYASIGGMLWVHAEFLRTLLSRALPYIDPEDTYLIKSINNDLGETKYLEGKFQDKLKEIENKIILEQFKDHGISASCSYADDSGIEWGAGKRSENMALELFDANPKLRTEMRDIAKGFLWSLESVRPES